MDERQLRANNDAAYRKARNNHARPYIALEDGDEGVFKMPDLGCYKPDGWETSNKYFVDSSGFGAENEPALTIKHFLTLVKKGRGYSIASAGQFQVHINEFTREAV